MKQSRGFSLLEVLIAAAILMLGLLPLLTVNRSSNRATLDAYYEFLAVQLAQEPIEVFRSVGYPECLQLQKYPVNTVTAISDQDDRYPAEAAMFEREITLDVSRLPLCQITVKVFPRAGSGARTWMRPGKEAVIVKGVIPVVR